MHDDDAKAILERRARYVAMALAGVGTATQAACGPCLSPLSDVGDPYADASIDAERPSTRIDVGDWEIDASADASMLEDTLGLDAALRDTNAASTDDAAIEDAHPSPTDDASILDATADLDPEDAP